MAGNGIGIGIGFRQGTLLNQFTDYVARVLADSGLIKDRSATSSYMKMAKSNGILDSIRFAWLGEAGYKQRTSGINTFWTKLYSLRGTNDATQTTSTSQPYITGNIAPTERIGMKNPNGGSNYMTHPAISFAANEQWSVTTVLKSEGSMLSDISFAGTNNTNLSELRIKGSNGNLFSIVNSLDQFIGSSSPSNNFITGKNIILSYVAYGNNTVKLYVNGILFHTFTGGTATSMNFSYLVHKNATLSKNFNGTISAHIIRSQALNPSQVAAEANFLRSLYPEIPSVTIGSQVWATSNCEMVATPMGNLIANVTSNATWADATNVYNTTYAATAGTDEQKTYAAVKAAAMWCYYNNDAAIGAIYGKLYNWYAVKLLQMDIDYYNAANPSTPWGWRVPTDTDFNTLATTLGGASVAGGKMKKDGLIYWASPNTGADNSSGFSAIGGGIRYEDGLFGLYPLQARFYNVYGTASYAYYDGIELLYEPGIKSHGNSLRLIKS